MSAILQATPLIALNAAAIDCEATGLDVRKARLIEIAVLGLEDGAFNPARRFETLVDCCEAIPVEATRVHGIDAGMIQGAPRFSAIHADLAAAIGSRALVGHTVGFDLALLRRECERAGLKPLEPVALDVRMLAQIVDPQLSSYSLEGLCAWLDLPIAQRHRAAGDAEAAGAIFLALVPRLREKGVRTLGEALRRCRLAADAMAQAAPAEWEPSSRALAAPPEEKSLSRLDSYPYRHRVREVMNREPVILPGTTTVKAALDQIAARKLSSVLVGDDLGDASTLAILTERDIIRLLVDGGAQAFDSPIGKHASRPLTTVPDDAYLYRAIGRMANLNIRHLVAIGQDEAVTGIVTTRDLLRFRSSSAIALGDDIDAAASAPELARAFAKLPAMAQALLAEGVEARAVASVIAREIGALTRAAAIMAERALRQEGKGAAPCAYAVLVLGSAGRGESLLAMDQDNALIFEAGEPGGAEDLWFAALGARMAAFLDEVGVPLCKGGVMASNPNFRGSVATWRARVERWLTRARPEDLLAVDILFDFQAVHGRRSLAADLWAGAWAAARQETAFLKLLGANAGETGVMTTFLGRIRTDPDGRIDLKGAVLKGVVTAARVLALRHGVARRATADRLAGLIERDVGSSADLAGLDADHKLALRLILSQQLTDIAAGRPPDNLVSVSGMEKADREALKAALSRQANIADLLCAGLGA